GCAGRIHSSCPVGSRPWSALRLLGELGAQPKDGTGVQLAHPGLGDAENPPDLGQGQVLEVVQGDDDAVAFGQLGDGIGELASAVLVDEVGDGILGVVVRQCLGQGGGAAAGGDQLVQRDDAGELELGVELPQLADGDGQLVGQLGVGGRALQPAAESFKGALDVASTTADRTRHPVLRAQV